MDVDSQAVDGQGQSNSHQQPQHEPVEARPAGAGSDVVLDHTFHVDNVAAEADNVNMRTATLGEVLDLWRDLAGRVLQPATVRRCAQCVERIFGDRPDLVCRSGVLRPAVRRWQDEWLARARGRETTVLARVIGSGRSMARQAAAVFAPRWCERYRDHGLRLDDGLAGVFRLVWPRAVVEYHPIDPAALHAAWEAQRQWPVEVRLAFALALGAGLRASELLRLRRGQLATDGERVVIRGVRGKGGLVCDQPVLEPCGRLIKALWPAGEADAPVFGSADVVRRLNGRLRGVGWASRHVCHELRALAICRAAELWGLEGARLFARHSNPSLTWQRYGRYFALFGRSNGGQSLWLTGDDRQAQALEQVVQGATDGQPAGTGDGHNTVGLDGDLQGRFGEPDDGPVGVVFDFHSLMITDFGTLTRGTELVRYGHGTTRVHYHDVQHPGFLGGLAEPGDPPAPVRESVGNGPRGPAADVGGGA